MTEYKLVCEGCQNEYRSDSGIYKCSKCQGDLRVEYTFPAKDGPLIEIMRGNGNKRMWNYRELLPVQGEQAVTMGEGNTPLVDAINLARLVGMDRVFIKNETLNPTGTFKDRCMSVSITRALELKAAGVILGSAGNAASAAAAYSARANLPCYVLIPQVTPLERVVQTMLYGGKVIQIDGTVNDCIDMIDSVREKMGFHNVTTASVHNPYQAEAPKTIAYEMGKQLDWEVPDWILVPIGGGGILSAIWKGYNDLYKLGLINKLPKMVGMQADGCAAVVKAFKAGKKSWEIEDWGKPDTIAAAIADPYPLDGKSALEAIYRSHGYSEWVADEEILSAQKALGGTEGIFAEPASSTTIAGLIKLRNVGIIRPGETATCVVTGTGLKDPKLAAKNIAAPPQIKKGIDELMAAIENYSCK